jgi:hypothetical protein
MSIKIKTLLVIQTILIVFLSTAILFLGGDLKQANKNSLSQSNYCIRYTSDIIASSRLDLIREQDAHKRDIDQANTKITDLIYRYNAIVARYNKNTGGFNFDPLNPYSYQIIRTIP